jgi:hypothetical protein
MLAAVRCLRFATVSLIAGLSVVAVVAVGACAGGSYVQGDRQSRDVDRGETNGRRFDFVSNKPQDDEWQIRITGRSMWVSYAKYAASDKLGSINLTDVETRRVWQLIDALDLANRKPGVKDEDEGYVSLQLKEPGNDGNDLHHVYVSRTTEDAAVIELAKYLQDLTAKYKTERPNF